MSYICTACGWEGQARRALRGSKGMEVFLWTVLLIPGPLYSLWRRMERSKQCPNCQRMAVVARTSEAGQIALRTFDAELGILTPKKPAPPSDMVSFGNDKPAGQPVIKKPVDPEQW